MEKTCTKKFCGECPFRRASAPGYLGVMSGDPWHFLVPHWVGEMPLPCHMRINWDATNRMEQVTHAPLCRGLLALMRNSSKMPVDPEIAALVRQLDRDPAVFANTNEFIQHHHNSELAVSFREDRA